MSSRNSEFIAVRLSHACFSNLPRRFFDWTAFPVTSLGNMLSYEWHPVREKFDCFFFWFCTNERFILKISAQVYDNFCKTFWFCDHKLRVFHVSNNSPNFLNAISVRFIWSYLFWHKKNCTTTKKCYKPPFSWLLCRGNLHFNLSFFWMDASTMLH